MKKKFLISLLLALTLIFLTACGGAKGDEAYYATVDKTAAKAEKTYDAIFGNYKAAGDLSYSFDFYLESMVNFDNANRVMPTDKTPSEKKIWLKPVIKYSYSKIDGVETATTLLTMPKVDENGYPVNDDNGKQIYEQTEKTVYVHNNGALTVYFNDVEIFSGAAEDFDNSGFGYFDAYDIVYDILERFSGITAQKSALLNAVNNKVLTETIVNYELCDIIDMNDNETPFRDSDFCRGSEEDISFDWTNIKTVKLTTVCLTSKKNKLTKLEFYNEYISSCNKQTTQIWNNETVTTWYGARTFASKIVIDIDY